MAIDCSELAKILYKLTQHHAADPAVKNIDDVIDRIKSDYPEVDREQLVNALVEASTGRARVVSQEKLRFEALKREARSDKKLHTAIERLWQHLKESTLPVGKWANRNAPDAIRVLQELQRELKSALKQSDPGLRQKLEKDIERLLERINQNDFAIPVNEKTISTNTELNRLEFERDKLRRMIHEKIRDAKPKTIWGHVAELSNAQRFFRAGYDFSMAGTQNVFNSISDLVFNPKKFADDLMTGFKAVASEQKAREIMNEIEARPQYSVYRAGKLRLSDFNSTDLNQADEAYMTNIFRRLAKVDSEKYNSLLYVPRKFGEIGHALGRGGTVYLNKTRADMFDALANGYIGDDMDVTRARALGALVNGFTGGGNLGVFETSAPILNGLMFSARNFASQLQREILFPAKFATGEILDLAGKPTKILGGKEVRRAVAARYGKFVAATAAIYALAAAAGAKIESDPLKSNYGSIMIPGTNISFNPMGGMRTLYVFLRRAAAGKKRTSSGEEIELRGPKSRPGQDIRALLGKFVGGKASPLTGDTLDLLSGKDVNGREVTPGMILGRQFVPMDISDTYQAIQDAGIPTGAAAGVLAFFGVPTQVFDEGPKKKTKRNVLAQ